MNALLTAARDGLNPFFIRSAVEMLAMCVPERKAVVLIPSSSGLRLKSELAFREILRFVS